jgi:hypothetical protein
MPEGEDENDENFDPQTMFAMVLEKDLANIVNKANSGAPLTKREREMIEQAGQQKKNPQGASFQLTTKESPLSGLTQPELAEKWGYSLRTIKNWIADGRAASDPAPLAYPAEMPAWFARIYSPRTAPDKLIEAVRKISTEFKETEAPAPPQIEETRLEVSDAEKGLLAMLERMRTAEAMMHARYIQAVDAGEKDKADYRFSQWEKIVEKLRALEKSAPSALAEAGIYVRKDDVYRELVQLHSGIIKTFKQAIRKGRLALQATKTADEFNRAADELVDKACSALCETDFSEPLELVAE